MYASSNSFCCIKIYYVVFDITIFSGGFADLNRNIYLIGGSSHPSRSSSNIVDVYDYRRDEWSQSCPMNDQRSMMGKLT